MAIFRVHVSQYVEETAVLEVEAATMEDAHASTKDFLIEGGEVEWEDGSDVLPATVDRIDNEQDETLWERDREPEHAPSKLLLQKE
jgi:hypothetical protein